MKYPIKYLKFFILSTIVITILSSPGTGALLPNNQQFEFLHVGNNVWINHGCWVMDIIKNSHGHIFVGTCNNGIIRSTDDGETWAFVNEGIPVSDEGYIAYIRALTFAPDGSILAGTSGYGVFRSSDNGDSWTPFNNSDHDIRDATTFFTNKNGDVFLGESGKEKYNRGGISRLSSENDTWIRINEGLERGDNGNIRPKNLVENSDGIIFAAFNSADNGNGIYSSSDNGESWIRAGLTGQNVMGLVINSQDHLFAGIYPQRIYRSTDDGESWIVIDESMNQVYCLGINSQDHIFVGTLSDGIYYSIDNGDSWNNILPNTGEFYCFAFDLNNKTYVGAIAYFAVTDYVSINEINSELPEVYSLEQNYPNPFNPLTTIIYSIAKPGHVTLEVFNILGQKVTTLFEGYRDAGSYSINWDASDQANGIYIAVMKAGGITKTEKMMMVK